MTTTVNQVMTSYYDAYNSEDPDRLAAVLDDSVILRSAAGTGQGLPGYLDTYRTMITTFVDRMTPQRIEADGDTATVSIVNTLTARADVPDFMGMKLKAGETLTLNLRGRYKVRDGRISEIDIELA
ncbi:nuclear transport factor 2 family protein [Actinocorallia libanotica]|uniref:SnoaL-like domain-containing protein n=1 Tax=Actinocorallia libanotica TaxID=46162 RepID=A0ABN1RVM9_9ACTN